MKVALIHDVKLPVFLYGGTERVIWWLAKALQELGHEVFLAARPGTECPYATVVPIDFSKDVAFQIPGAQVLHYFETPKIIPNRPYVVTIGGNGQPGETYPQNTAFVSRNHAERHGAECFVHNGIDPGDYRYSEVKEEYLVFLAKASWPVKNVKGAIRYARAAKREMQILGGSAWISHWRGIHWRGMVGGEEKAKWLEKARALLFPVLWDEPFGLAVVEAMVSGTPVIATPRGSLPEIVTAETGFLCAEKSEFLSAIESASKLSSKKCREHVIENFHYHVMARKYLTLYERVLSGEALNKNIPRTLS